MADKSGGRTSQTSLGQIAIGILWFASIIASLVLTAVYGWPEPSFAAYFALAVGATIALGLVEKYLLAPQ